MAAPVAPIEVETALAHALSDLTEPAWRIVDVRRASRPGPRIDLVVVGPTGICVIAAARAQDKPRARTKLASGLLDAAEALAELTGVHRDEVHPVLCLLGETTESGWSRGVTTCGATDLAETLTFRRSVLSPAEVDEAARTVRHAMAGRGRHRA